jgi:hypothetical protein
MVCLAALLFFWALAPRDMKEKTNAKTNNFFIFKSIYDD